MRKKKVVPMALSTFELMTLERALGALMNEARADGEMSAYNAAAKVLEFNGLRERIAAFRAQCYRAEVQ